MKPNYCFHPVKSILLLLIALLPLASFAQDSTMVQQDSTKVSTKANEESDSKSIIRKLGIRGYTQIRYNRLLETNPDLKCDQCDKSWGRNGGLFIRRARLAFSGDVTDRLFVYFQADFASETGGVLNFAQMRDAYVDVALDKNKEYRFRIGQSKIPYGFENMQSSQNRIPLDRNDAINSALANERDVAVLFYWTPKHIRARLKMLTDSGLKGAGDYGAFGFGVFNGQTANRQQIGDDLHVVARMTWPFLMKSGQIIEPAIQAYTGKVAMPASLRTKAVDGTPMYQDSRVAGSLSIYPQPLGLQMEWNTGVGPEYDPISNSIETKRLEGGYAMLTYKLDFNGKTAIPFARYQYYNGGKKHELDARRYRVKEQEFGVEWHLLKNFELVTMYTISDRTFEDAKNPSNRQRGSLLRLQVQFSY